jgi:hypothetical protein
VGVYRLGGGEAAAGLAAADSHDDRKLDDRQLPVRPGVVTPAW